MQIPYNFIPRDYQLELFQAMDGVQGKPGSGKKRALCIWHRRAGKDKAAFSYMVKEAVKTRGIYYYFLPTYQQGRMVIWEQKDIMQHLPDQVILRKHNQDMMIELTNGSIIRIVGTDNIDRIVGTNPIGCVFSEYSLQDPQAWVYISPILAENDGWAIFNGTPRGRNHLYKLHMAARKWEDWYVSQLTVADTKIEKRLINKINEDRELHGEDFVQQEYYVSYSAGMRGSFYADQVEKARGDGRIGKYQYDDHKYVDTFWDLGVDDSTSVWFRQITGNSIVWIDYFEDSGKALNYYIQILADKGYKYRTHYLPHDGASRTIQTQYTTAELFRMMCKDAEIATDVVVVKKQKVQDGINAVRSRFSRYCFNEGTTSDGIQKIELYHRRFDPKRQTFLKEAVHDWTSHAADALRMEAQAFIMEEKDEWNSKNFTVQSEFDPFE